MKKYLGLMCVLSLLLAFSPVAEAGTITVRGAKTPVDAINSIALDNAFHTKPIIAGNLKATVFALTFSIQAYKDDISIPLSGGFGTTTASDPRVRYEIDSKGGWKQKGNGVFAVSSVIPNASTTKNRMVIKAGTRGSMTILVALADRPETGRFDQLHITSIPLYFGTSTKPVLLNPSEVSKLHTDSVELADTPK